MRVETPQIDTHSMRRIKNQAMATCPFPHLDFVFGISISYEHAREISRKHKGKLVLFNATYKGAGGTIDQWQEVWDDCLVVASYFDLRPRHTSFVRMPLGFDPEAFYFKALSREKGSALVTGFLDGPPSEEIVSVAETFTPTYHIGPSMKDELSEGAIKGYNPLYNIPDQMLNRLYNQVEFVAGMRYTEGFELPAVEGMACGATPIVFEEECYRRWYDGVAYFVDPDKDILPQLKAIKEQGGKDEDMLISNSYRFRQDIVWQDLWEVVGNAL